MVVDVAVVRLCAGRNDNVVRYALAGTSQPLAVADYTYNTLPATVRAAVPHEKELVAAGAALSSMSAAARGGEHGQ